MRAFSFYFLLFFGYDSFVSVRTCARDTDDDVCVLRLFSLRREIILALGLRADLSMDAHRAVASLAVERVAELMRA